MSNYQMGVLQNSAKMVLLFYLIDESVRQGDKILVFRLVHCSAYVMLTRGVKVNVVQGSHLII